MAIVKKITQSDFRKLVLEETAKIKKQLAEEAAYKVLEDPLETKLNVNDGLEDQAAATVYKNTTKTENKKGNENNVSKGYEKAPIKMNALKNEKGSDTKAATAVEVSAGSEKGGKGPTAGQKNATFTSKKENPKTEVSKPFIEKSSEKQNEMDKLTDETTKTFIEPGAKRTGNDSPTAGQHKPTIKEKAPVVKDKEKIFKGIETTMGDSNISLKESYSKAQLIEVIRKEAFKIAKKTILKEELDRINQELSDLQG